MLCGNIKHAYFGGQNKCIVIGYIVARGTQPVSVKHRAYGIAIRKKYGCGAVPRLHHCRVIVIKISFGSGYGLAVAPRLGDSNHYGKRQVHSVHNKKFQRVIKHGRVRPRRVYNGQDFIHIVLHNGAFHCFLARQHTVNVAANGIYFTVVQYKAVRVGALPAGRCVGGKARVHKRYCTFISRILQIKVKATQLPHQKHTLVNYCSA